MLNGIPNKIHLEMRIAEKRGKRTVRRWQKIKIHWWKNMNNESGISIDVKNRKMKQE
jgi:hypothetical protein